MARFTSTTRNTSRNRRRIGDRTAADRPSRRAGIDGGAVIACSPPSSRFGWQPTASAGVLIWLPAPTRLPPGSRARHQNMPGCGRPITDQTKGVTDVAEKSNAGKASAGASDSAASGPGHSDESFQREITTRMQSFFEAARLQPIFDAQQRMLTDVVSRLQPGEVLSRIQSVFEAQPRAVAEAARRPRRGGALAVGLRGAAEGGDRGGPPFPGDADRPRPRQPLSIPRTRRYAPMLSPRAYPRPR